jgi:hypothetical protein
MKEEEKPGRVKKGRLSRPQKRLRKQLIQAFMDTELKQRMKGYSMAEVKPAVSLLPKRWFGVPIDNQRSIDVWLPNETTVEDLEFFIQTIELWKANFARAEAQASKQSEEM